MASDGSPHQVLAFRGLAAALAKPALLALHRRLRVERERQRREREKRALEERRKKLELERREAERVQRMAEREAGRVSREAAKLAKRVEREEDERRYERELIERQLVVRKSSFVERFVALRAAVRPVEEDAATKASRRAAAKLQATVRARAWSAALRRMRSAALVVQGHARRYICRSRFKRRRASARRLQPVWRGVVARRIYTRLKTALLLDEAVACDAMRMLVSMFERSGLFQAKPTPPLTPSSMSGIVSVTPASLPSTSVPLKEAPPSLGRWQFQAPDPAATASSSDEHTRSLDAGAHREGQQLQHLLQQLPGAAAAAAGEVLQQHLASAAAATAAVQQTLEAATAPLQHHLASAAAEIQAATAPLQMHLEQTVQQTVQTVQTVQQTLDRLHARWPTVLKPSVHANKIFRRGLKANQEGRTLVACDLVQRAAAISRLPSLNMLLSMGNLRLKLGQPNAALLAYRYMLVAAEPSSKHAQMARRKLHEALLLGASDAASRISMLSAADSVGMQSASRAAFSQPPQSRRLSSRTGLFRDPNEAEAVHEFEQRARRWLAWLGERAQFKHPLADMPESHPAAVMLLVKPSVVDVVEAVVSALSPDGPAPSALPAPEANRPLSTTSTTAEQRPPAQPSLSEDAEGARLTYKQKRLLERLLLDAITGSSSRTDSTEVSHGGVRLQLGATLRQVDLQLMRPAARGSEPAANAAATATLVMPTAPHIVGAAADPRIPFFHLRLRDLVLRYQRRARGGSRLRVAAMPLEAYDLRGALRVQTIGVVGKRVHGPVPAGSLHLHEPPMGRPAPGSRSTVGTDGVASQDWAWAVAHSRYQNGAVSPRSTSSSPPMSPQSSLADYPHSPRPSPNIRRRRRRRSCSRRRRRRSSSRA